MSGRQPRKLPSKNNDDEVFDLETLLKVRAMSLCVMAASGMVLVVAESSVSRFFGSFLFLLSTLDQPLLDQRISRREV